MIRAIDNDLTKEQIDVINIVASEMNRAILANNVVDKVDAKKLILLLKNIGDNKLMEVLEKVDAEKLVDVLNEYPEIIAKILSTTDGANKIQAINDKIKNTTAALKLNKTVRDSGISVDTLLPVTDVNLIDDDLFVEKFNQLASAGLKIQYINRIEDDLDSLSTKKIAALIKDSGSDARAKLFGTHKISEFSLDDINKLLTGDASWLINLIKPEELIKMDSNQINALKTKFQAQWNDIVKGIKSEQISALDADVIDAIQKDLTNDQWNDIVKDITAEDLITFDAHKIRTIQAGLTNAQWNDIAKKISAEQISTLNAEEIQSILDYLENVEQKYNIVKDITAARIIELDNDKIAAIRDTLTPEQWHEIVKNITSAQLSVMDAAKINELKKELSQQDWDTIVTKMEGRDVHNLTAEQITAINSPALLAKLHGTNTQGLSVLSVEKKRAIRNILQLNNNLSHEEKLALGYTNLTSGVYGMGGKTKRSKIKQNKTRKL